MLIAVGGAIACGSILYMLMKRRRAPEPASDDSMEFSHKVHPSVAEEPAPVEAVAPADEGVRVFANIGAGLRLPEHWTIAEDISPVPNVAMISMTNTKYTSASNGAAEMPGSVPVLVLSVEDNAQEGLDLEEFKEKSKQTAMQQMFMMTNGMVPPRILFDGAQDNGVFEMVLEYALETPMFQLRVINFITMRDDLAYVMQFMGNAEVFAAEIDDVREIARNFSILPLPHQGPLSQNVVTDADAGYSVHLPVNWVIDSRETEAVAAWTRVLSMSTATPVKTEKVELFKLTEKGTFSEKTLRALAEADKGAKVAFFAATAQNAKAPASRKYAPFFEADIAVLEYQNVAMHHVCVYAIGEFCIRVTPLRVQTSVVKSAAIISTLRSLYADATETSVRYVNGKHGFSFPIKERSRIVESRIGDNTVTLAPEGIQAELLENISAMKPTEQTFEPTPIFTIRTGDPTTDKDCETSLENWMARLRSESARADVKMNELRYEKFSAFECVTFTQKEMQETGPGKKDEHLAKIFVLVNAGKTFMLRWETPTEVWKKFEPKLERIIDDFRFETIEL